ncbi:MAG: methyltransferase domain-containing protein [Candidatus Zixiibacteriota bacterium]|nr:MAG: methyltransferase domain-containing protein [candidate division Zixibacteria bacterium]
MEPFKYHVYVCNQQKPEGVPGCAAHGSEKVIDCLRKEIMKNGLGDTVQITTCGSIGLCERGPNMVVYPEGIWYSGLTVENVSEIVTEHFKSGKVVERLVNTDVSAVRAEIDTNKKRMMAAFKAQDEAGVLPDELNQRIRGFQISRVILSAVELDIFSAVDSGASAAEVAKKLDIDSRATEMFLNALVSLNLLEKKDASFYNTPISSRYFVEGAPDDSRASLMHTVHLWGRWSTLTECIGKGTSVTYKDMVDRGDEWTVPFIAAMHKSATARAPQVIRTVGLEKVSKMLDVGGGSGAYSIAAARANESLRAEVFDLPTVIPIAQKHIDEAGLSDRVTTRAGDMRKDDFGIGFDLVFISAICHMNSPEENVELLEKSFKALSENGRVVIQDFILKDDKTSPPTAALFALNMLVGTRGGSSYSEAEYTGWLKKTGFEDIKLIRLPGPTALIIGRK